MTGRVSSGSGSGLDTSVPHSARVWNHWLGGKDNFTVDRQLGERIRQMYPEIVEIARVSRAFLVRSVRYLAAEVGIRQFLDIGTGLPTANNTHEVAQAIAPECRVRALLTSTPEGRTDYVDADARDPDAILREAARTLDLDRPARSPEQIAHFLDGLRVVEPGVVSTPRWRPDPDDEPVDLGVFCGVALKTG